MSLGTSNTRKRSWQNENGQTLWSAGNSYGNKMKRQKDKKKSMNNCEGQGQQPVFRDSSPTTMDDKGCRSLHQANHTHTRPKANNAKHLENVIGAENEASFMDTIAGTVNIPMSGAPVSQGGVASSLPITRSTTPTSSTRTSVPMAGITMDESYEGDHA